MTSWLIQSRTIIVDVNIESENKNLKYLERCFTEFHRERWLVDIISFTVVIVSGVTLFLTEYVPADELESSLSEGQKQDYLWIFFFWSVKQEDKC